MCENLKEIMNIIDYIGYKELPKEKILFKDKKQKELYVKGIYKKYKFDGNVIDIYVDIEISDDDFKEYIGNLSDVYKYQLRNYKVKKFLKSI